MTNTRNSLKLWAEYNYLCLSFTALRAFVEIFNEGLVCSDIPRRYSRSFYAVLNLLAWLLMFQEGIVDLSHVYLAYTEEGAEEALRPKTASKTSKSGRPKTANRPKSSRAK